MKLAIGLGAKELGSTQRGSDTTSGFLPKSSISNQPRNIGFELLIAASASSAGVRIDLVPPSDLLFLGEARQYFVECKRPFSEQKLANRIRAGLTQLKRRYESATCPAEARGILAVSISRIINDGSFILNLANAGEAVDAEMNRIFDLLVSRYQRYWAATDPRTVAILFELRTASQLAEPSLFTNLTQHVFVLRYEQGSLDRKELDEILTKFDNRMRRPAV